RPAVGMIVSGSLWAGLLLVAGAGHDGLEWFAQPFRIVALVVLAVSVRAHYTPRGILMFIASLLLSPVTLILVAASPIAAQDKKATPGAEQVQFRPKGFTGKLTPYDLEEVFQDNKKKAEAGKAHNYSSFLLKEFSGHYYPKATFQWHRVGSTSRNI